MAKLRGGTLRITLAQNLETMLRRGRGVHFFVGVEDVDQFYDDLIARGADVQPPIDEGWGGRFVTLEDPDKYRYFFVTWSDDRRRRSDECRDNILRISFAASKGEVVDVKTVSGGIYSGRISEITNDYVCLTETRPEPGQQVFLSFSAIESIVVGTTDSEG